MGPTTLLPNYKRAQGNLWSAEYQGLRQKQHRGHTPSSRIEIKIPDPAGIRNRGARDSLNHATTDTFKRMYASPKPLKTIQYITF